MSSEYLIASVVCFSVFCICAATVLCKWLECRVYRAEDEDSTEEEWKK